MSSLNIRFFLLDVTLAFSVGVNVWVPDPPPLILIVLPSAASSIVEAT